MKHSICIVLGAILLAFVTVPSALSGAEEGMEAHKRGDFSTAFKEWEPLAMQGDAAVQSLLGSMYYNGQYVSQDYEQAKKWFLLSAKQVDATAFTFLGVMHILGRGVPEDFKKGYMWLDLAVANGMESAAVRRDQLALKMPIDQLSEARLMVITCIERKYTDC